jgi:hypothetical protein
MMGCRRREIVRRAARASICEFEQFGVVDEAAHEKH